MIHRTPACLLFFLLLAACSSAPPALENSDWQKHRLQLQSLDTWELDGRVNVRYDNESETPRIRWLQQSNEYHIRLWGTFNVGNTTITGRPGYVTLEQGNDLFSASSPEQLIEQQLGYELPVSNLKYWVKGLPAPQLSNQLQFNELNQLSSLSQDGWTIDYSDYRQYGDLSLPSRIDLNRENKEIRLRFVRLSWTVNPGIGTSL